MRKKVKKTGNNANREKKKKLKTKNIVLGAIIIFIMTTSIIGFMTGKDSSSETYTYKNFKFKSYNNYFTLDYNNTEIIVHTLPESVEDIELSDQITNSILATRMVYTTYDPKSEESEILGLAQYELSNTLMNTFEIYNVNAFTENSTYDLPVITCENATSSVPVIYFVDNNETKIEMINNCIMIKGKSLDFLYLKDRLIFGLLNIL